VPGVYEDVARYYAAKLAAHGPTPRGVDWNSGESQELRFTHLLTLCGDRGASILDYGCGYGALAARLRRDGHVGEYVGFDVSREMVNAARAANQNLPRCRFTANPTELAPAGYTLASGIFNVRLSFTTDMWEGHILKTLETMAQFSTEGFAFNMLTRYADEDRMRPDLYYADPGAWLTYCLDRFSRHAILMHDSELYEFTILVRLDSRRRR
jgi:SAM-dependent methyltransferase